MIQVLEEMNKLDLTDYSIIINANKKELYITINDCEGFGDNWEEIDRPLADDIAMGEFIVYLEKHSHEYDSLYDYYYFGDWCIVVDYESANI